MTKEHLTIINEMLASHELHPEEAEALSALLELAKIMANHLFYDDDVLLIQATEQAGLREATQ